MFEHVGGASYGRHVVDDELAVRGEEVAPLVELLYASLVLTICNDAVRSNTFYLTHGLIYTPA